LMKLYKGEIVKNIPGLALLSLSFLPIIFWKVFCYIQGVNSGDEQIFNTSLLSNLIPRLNDLENYTLISYFILLNEKFLFTLAFFLISFWFRRNKELFSFVTITTTIYILILYLIYLSTPLEFHFQLDSTVVRVIKSVSFFLGFFALSNLVFFKLGK